MKTTLIFDCDGVLAETERDGHLLAFNQTFSDFALPVLWSKAEYGRHLQIGGGKERLASLLTPEFIAAAGLSDDPVTLQAEVAQWHQHKTKLFTEMVTAGKLPARPGITRIIGDALAAGWQLAVASTSAEASVRAIVHHVAPAGTAERIAIFAGDVVAQKKPAPDIYQFALARLNADPAHTLVIEDSRNGLLAATRAGLRSVITISDYTADEDFSEATLVVSSLGDPGGEATRIVANRSAAQPGKYLTLHDLRCCLAAAISTG